MKFTVKKFRLYWKIYGKYVTIRYMIKYRSMTDKILRKLLIEYRCDLVTLNGVNCYNNPLRDYDIVLPENFDNYLKMRNVNFLDYEQGEKIDDNTYKSITSNASAYCTEFEPHEKVFVHKDAVKTYNKPNLGHPVIFVTPAFYIMVMPNRAAVLSGIERPYDGHLTTYEFGSSKVWVNEKVAQITFE